MDDVLAWWDWIQARGGPALAAAWRWTEAHALALHGALKAAPYGLEAALAVALAGWIAALLLWRTRSDLRRRLDESGAALRASEERLAGERRWREATARVDQKAATAAAAVAPSA
ncbi:hypothetical protein [Salinarimonas soli]|uniref:Uncharacterized protein n=1 Tax=Salinarimonas soli TaxID=1638099 RepID=A0A5B2VCH9_9HYPH|nr:hypothetical protein [Salinarimonas soli]KAA2236019.1 hypothetical protein F0L46_16725 [Salinarimonas soli]